MIETEDIVARPRWVCASATSVIVTRISATVNACEITSRRQIQPLQAQFSPHFLPLEHSESRRSLPADLDNVWGMYPKTIASAKIERRWTAANWLRMLQEMLDRLSRREALLIALPAFAALCAFWLLRLLRARRLPCRDNGDGLGGGAYEHFGKSTKEALAREGIELRLRDLGLGRERPASQYRSRDRPGIRSGWHPQCTELHRPEPARQPFPRADVDLHQPPIDGDD